MVPTDSVGKRGIPLGAKLAYTAFMAVLVPFYWYNYGPTNFLYFCDVALFLTLYGMWREYALPISIAAVGIMLPQILWVVDFAANLAGADVTGMTDYMFDATNPLFNRGLSLFHGWLPLLLWLLMRLGYDRRAFAAWTADGLPALGALDSDVFIALGANGYTLAPVYAEVLSSLVQGHPSPIPLDDLDPARLRGEGLLYRPPDG